MSKVTMSSSFLVSNPEGWAWKIAPDEDNSDFVQLTYVSDGAETDNFVFTRDEAMLIASALQKLVITK